LSTLSTCSIAGGVIADSLSQWPNGASNSLAAVDNYTCVLHRQERIDGRMTAEELIQLKFRKPYMICMDWTGDRFKGRKALYVKGANKGKMRAREGRGIKSWVGGLWLEPEGVMAMAGNRHPMHDAALTSMIELLTDELAKGLRNGDVTVKELGEETVYGRKTIRVEEIFKKEKVINEKGRLDLERKFKKTKDRYYCRRTVMNIDLENHVPVMVRNYDENNDLIEMYGFENLRLGAGLTDADFSLKKNGLE